MKVHDETERQKAENFSPLTYVTRKIGMSISNLGIL